MTKKQTFLKTMVLVSILALTVACGKKRGSAWDDGGSDAPVVHAVKLDPATQKLWDNRHDEADLRKAVTVMEAQLLNEPNNYALLILLSRAYYVLGDGHLYLKLTNDKEKDATVIAEQSSAYDRSIYYAERAMATNKDFLNVVKTGALAETAFDKLTLKEIDSIYWRYAALARWSRMQGLTTLLANRSKFAASMKRVEELNKDFWYASVPRYKGGAEALSPGGKKEVAEKWFQQALKEQPNFFQNHVLYADAYAKSKINDEALFRKHLEIVIKGKPESIPEIKSEQIIEQKKAQKFMDQIDDLF